MTNTNVNSDYFIKTFIFLYFNTICLNKTDESVKNPYNNIKTLYFS